jgi:hypothetical protein
MGENLAGCMATDCKENLKMLKSLSGLPVCFKQLNISLRAIVRGHLSL